MKRITLGEKLRFSMVEPNYPSVGLEFNSDCIRLVAVTAERGALRLQHADVEPLPAGAVEITPFKANINSMESTADALRRLWSRNTYKVARVAVLLQDRCALTFNTVMEHPAKNATDCMELIRFKLKKNVPFRMEDAQVTYFTPAGIADPSAANLWIVVLNHAVLQQYEQFVQSVIDAECGLVDLATINVMNLAHSDLKARNIADHDIMYINLNHDYVSLAITQKGHLTSFRTRPLESGVSVTEAAMEEIHPTAMYYQDKLGGEGLACAFVYSTLGAEELRTEVESRIGVPSVLLTLDAYAGSRFDPSNRALLNSYAPLAGMLLSRKVEYV